MLDYVCKKYGSLIHIFDPLFTVNFYCAAGVKYSTFQKRVKSLCDLQMDDDTRGRSGWFQVYERKDGNQIGFIWADDKEAHLAHECFHATHWTLDRAGLKLTDDSEEAYAYHQSFLIKCVLGRW